MAGVRVLASIFGVLGLLMLLLGFAEGVVIYAFLAKALASLPGLDAQWVPLVAFALILLIAAVESLTPFFAWGVLTALCELHAQGNQRSIQLGAEQYELDLEDEAAFQKARLRAAHSTERRPRSRTQGASTQVEVLQEEPTVENGTHGLKIGRADLTSDGKGLCPYCGRANVALRTPCTGCDAALEWQL